MKSIKENAIFISDSHYNKERIIFHTLLKKIESKELNPSQVFLMGDMFDFLSNEISYFKKINKEVVDTINNIAKTTEVIYLEGNHDYNLKKIFPDVLVIPRDKQPYTFLLDDKKVSLAHGDIFTPKSYDIFTSIIRNSIVLHLLNLIDINNWLTKKVENFLMSKNICKKQKHFKEFVEKRKKQYNSSLIIEGHFHQGLLEDDYINIPALCCSKEYLLFKDGHFKFDVV